MGHVSVTISFFFCFLITVTDKHINKKNFIVNSAELMTVYASTERRSKQIKVQTHAGA